jgi:L-2,4-diaminobutyrate transaminase
MSDEDFAAKLADDLEALILAEGPETIAAFIAEPVMGAGGVLVPPETYFERVQAVLRRHDVLLIADEVITAFGRLGRWFGSELFGIEPDLITVAKGLTSGYFPLSGCIVSDPVWRVLVDGSAGGPFGHGYTYSAHPLAAAVAMTNLDLIQSEGLVARAAERGTLMHTLLREAFGDHPLVGEVRGTALLGALEFVAAKEPARRFDPSRRVAARVTRRCLELGLITRALPDGDTISFSPPFVITEEEVAELVRIARQAADDVWAELRRAWAWAARSSSTPSPAWAAGSARGPTAPTSSGGRACSARSRSPPTVRNARSYDWRASARTFASSPRPEQWAQT